MTGQPATSRVKAFGDASGALADLGTLLPLVAGVIAVTQMPAVPVLAGFGLFYLATGLYYRLPVPVQPMKAVAAIAIAGGASAGEIAASGVIVGAFLLVLGVTGWINHVARLVPQSILAGLQLGLGISLGFAGLQLAVSSPAAALAIIALVAVLLRFTRWPAALAALVFAGLLSFATGIPAITLAISPATSLAGLTPLALQDFTSAATGLALPQMALTLTNAVVLTALIARDCFGDGARHVTPSRLSISSGLANLLMTPLGAFPMCHGAGGLVAHHRFGARTGLAPVLIGLGLLVIAVAPVLAGRDLLLSIPAAALGALLIISSWQLAVSRRLTDARPSCWPVIAATALTTVMFDPFIALLAGTACEAVRQLVLRLLGHQRQSR